MKLKRFVAASLAAVTVFSLAACGSKSADTTTKAAGETKATGETGGSSATSGETFKLGTFLQLTGANSVAGNESNNTLDMVIDYINENGGFNGAKIEKVDDWGKRKLAYEIAKVNEGFYSFTTFEAPAAAPAEIEARMRIMENVLRYLIIRKDA